MPAAIDAGDTALAECAALLRDDFASFAACCFRELNPRTPFVTNWHYGLVAAKLAAVRDGRIRRLLISVPPRHLKPLTASVAFPAWCLGHDPSTQIICASYAQDLADKLSRDCRRVMASDWYRRDYPTRLSPQRQAMSEFETTAQGCRVATSVGGVLTGRGADIIIIDDPLKPEEALSQAQRQAPNEWYDHTLYSRLKRYGALYFVFLEVFYRGSDLEQRSNLPRCLSRYLLALRHSLTAFSNPPYIISKMPKWKPRPPASRGYA